MKQKITLTVIILMLSLSVLGQRKNKKVLPKQTEIFSNMEIDTDVSILPSNYCGNDISAINKEIEKRENIVSSIVKDEFETTQQFRERKGKLKVELAKPLLEKITTESLLAVEVSSPTFGYNADRNLMRLSFDKHYLWFTNCYKDNNQIQKTRKGDYFIYVDNETRKFDGEITRLKQGLANLRLRYTNKYPKIAMLEARIARFKYLYPLEDIFENPSILKISISNYEPESFDNLSFEIDLLKAKNIKSNLRTLLVGNLSKKENSYFENDEYLKLLNLDVSEIWIYDYKTGEIFLKHRIRINKNDSINQIIVDKNTKDLYLKKAEQFYASGKDIEAISLLDKIISLEPFNAISFLIKGKIYLRQEKFESARSNLTTAIFWDKKLIEAHILLGQLYLKKGDCSQAKRYSKSAILIDSENQDAISLQNEVDKCVTKPVRRPLR